jgi:predicted amidohydrolase YtcJ
MSQSRQRFVPAIIAIVLTLAGCSTTQPADLILVNAHVYSLDWPEPDLDGKPAAGAPHDASGWHPNADAVAIRGGRIAFVGKAADAQALRGPQTTVRDLAGATVVPGLIDAHVHLAELGASLERVNLVGVQNEAEAVARIAQRAASVPKGEWIEGWGWDEGAWASHYPGMTLLTKQVPDHPVLLRGLHSFAVWGNRLAFERASITAATTAPAGGEIKKDARGQPTGVLLNHARDLLIRAVPAPTGAQLEARLVKALDAMVAAGYVSVEEAGADAALLSAFERLKAAGKLPLRVGVMLAARDPQLVDAWKTSGPDTRSDKIDQMLVVRSVKAFYDGAMGSRGAFFLEDYSDVPGHRGAGGAAYGFDRDRMAAMMKSGFQIVIHAIGDRANREVLDLIEEIEKQLPDSRTTRPRIEHAQVVSPADLPRFGRLGVIASMQPSHAVEDMPWAQDRIGPLRIAGAYAWRSLRRAGARLVFNSDLPATDFNIFYGLHSASTRQDRQGKPAGGWRPEERLSIEEALRGWTTWAAYAAFRESVTGTIKPGRWADLTVMDIDPFQIGEQQPDRLLNGRIRLTIVGGKVVFDAAR